MNSCTNTLMMGKPTANGVSSQSCNTSCTSLGPVDPLDKNKLGPRPNRELVREQIKDYCLLMLGAPVVKIELDEQNLDFAVDWTLSIIEEYASREHFSYYTFITQPGKSVYEMPPDIGIIRNVFYRQTAQFAFNANDLGGVIPLEYFTGFGSGGTSAGGGIFTPNYPIWGDMSTWTIYKEYEHMYAKVSSQLGGWEWVGGLGHIKLYPIPCGGQHVIVHYLQKNKDWKQVTQAMEEGCLAKVKEILGRIRSKYVSPPGPGGGMQLDGATLLAEGREEQEKWKNDLIFKFSELPMITMS